MSPVFFWFKKWFYTRENTLLGRQRLVLFESSAVISILLTIARFILPPETDVTKWLDSTFILLTVIILYLYDRHYLSVQWASSTLFVFLQVQLSIQMVFFTTLMSSESAALVLQASCLSLLLITVSILSFLKYTPSILSALSILSFTFCLIVFPHHFLISFSPVYYVVLVGVIAYDLSASRPIMAMGISQEHRNLEFDEFLYATGLTEEDVRNVTKLARNNADKTETTRNMLSLMNTRARKNIVNSVLNLKKEDESTRQILMTVFPDLTPSQIAICQLVLQDKKLSEICSALGKSESNVSSQRSRIRAALEVPSDRLLKDVLEERLNIYLSNPDKHYTHFS